ncbi:dermonecrotic toxin domain-containing protein [Pseudomonas huanghezhanensis]|uniref:dermonecrotic toxin domain-containing protein n=1 Tax=Pseudomonas huanghezhanensis TaxID=3002903 RepID=UPI002286A147|nr:DUF6543 domain-containing protein [Pseudomonas sp. BSw22131]
MNVKFDVIDTFSRRPTLLPLALAALQAALKAQYPDLEINPAIAVITRVSLSGKPKSETLLDCLRQGVATGKTLQWRPEKNTLIAEPAALLPVTMDVDVEQLAVLVDSVSLDLLAGFMHALVAFWDTPDETGSSPLQSLVAALKQLGPRPSDSSAIEGTAQSSRVLVIEAATDADFERQALDSLEAQLLSIRGVLSLGLGDFDEIERCLAHITDISPLLRDKASENVHPAISRLDQLPDWLRAASVVDRLAYSRQLSALAVVGARAEGKSWDDDLPPILEYARRVMQDSMRADHLEATGVTLDDVTVQLAKVVAAAIPSAGQIVSVGSVENIRMSVAVFALENLSSLPDGTVTLSTKDGGPLPSWLTPDYLKQLVTRVDIGRTYPALVRHYLITDQAQAARREVLFADQLRVQLPLKALEQKIRGEGNMSDAGYRRIRSLLQPSDDTATGVLRPLAFIAQPGAPADQVSNMFVITDADPAVGPWVLYRPFARVPLTEFVSGAALRDAIAQTGELQEQTLAWMSEHAWQRYANGGFDQPHVVRFGEGSEFAPLETPAPAQLDTTAVNGDVFAALFKANALALADLAEVESVSNAESRWALIKRGGWLALDAVMPFLSGSVGSALWLVQLMISVDHVLAAESRKAKQEGVEAWNTLLLTISMILLHQGFSPRIEFSRRQPLLESKALARVFPSEPPLESGGGLPANAGGLLDYSWSSSRHRLTVSQASALERLKVTPEPALGAESVEPATQGLYLHDQQWFVRLESGVYRVVSTEAGVSIVDGRDPSITGPSLRRINQAWTLDLTLRLRGGAPKRNARQLALENAATLKRVIHAKALLDQRRDVLYQKFAEWGSAVREKPEDLSSEHMTRIEAELTELSGLLEQKKQLDLALRPADRTADKSVAKDLRGVCRRIAFFEGGLLMEVRTQARNRMAGLQAVSRGNVTVGNVKAYLKLFEDLLVLQNRGVHWSRVREALWLELRAVPKVGEESWRAEVVLVQQDNFFSHLEWRIRRLWSHLELSFSEHEILSGNSARELKQLRNDDRMHGAFSSHAALENPNDFTLSEQIGVLESSLREYQRGALIATCAQESAPEVVIYDQFKLFIEDLSWISERAEKRLSDLIRENAEPPEQPSEYAPKIKQLRKRVFKTRFQRMLIGSLRDGESELPGAVVDVTEGMGEAVVSTYHLHENGEWVEVEVVPPSRPVPRVGTSTLAELKRQAGVLLGRVETEIGNARRQSKRVNEPEDMQDILVQRADKLSALADKLASKSGDDGPAGGAASDVQGLVASLRSGADRLVEEGRAIRIAMIKAQPPTAARLSYMAKEREVDIARFDARKNMSGARRDDFLQEYVIRDKQQRVLWWAHFHYASEAAAADAFTAAHLKLPEQRFIGYKALIKSAKDNQSVVAVYRSVISKEVARRLFPGVTVEQPSTSD